MPIPTSAIETALPTRTEGATEPLLRAQVLGPVRIWRQGVELDLGPRQQRCLFALLMARAGQQVGMREILEMLWAGNPPASAVNIVHKYVSSLRRLLEPQVAARGNGSWLVRHGNGYQLADDPQMSDLVCFRRLVGQAQVAARAADSARALQLYQRALRLWNGRYAGDLATSTFEVAEFDSINRELFDAAAQAAELALRENDPAGLLSPLRRIAGWDPMNEPLQAQLIQILDVAGHKVEALAVYDSVRRCLEEEFALEPGPDLRSARRQVLQRAAAGERLPVYDTGRRKDDASPVTGRRHDDVGKGPVLIRPVAASVRVVPAQLPSDLPVFVGRDDELAFVRDLVGRSASGGRLGPVIVGLSGMPGVGKSTLAVHLGHAFAGEYEDGQIYLDLRGEEVAQASTGRALETILLSLGLPAASLPSQLEARVSLYRSLTAGKKMIVLLDNARSIQQVRPLIPNSATGLVLVTSRTPLPGLAAVEGASLLPIGLPPEPTARDMLAARWPPGLPAETRVLKNIVEVCGRLPLALALVAARACAFPGLSPGDLAAELRCAASPLEVFARDGGPEDPRSLFSWSYRQLGEPAARLFRLLALSPGETVSVPDCAALLEVEPGPARALLAELASSSLICEVAPGRFGTQVLVRAYAQELLLATDSAEEQRRARDRLSQSLLTQR